MLPVQLNDIVTVPFVLDSGAAEVSIPLDVLSVLRRAGTISDTDFIGHGKYSLADGQIVSSERYIIRKLRIGSRVVTDVIANVVPTKGDPLLGQSFLQRLPAWTLDNAKHALVIHDGGPERKKDRGDNNLSPRLEPSPPPRAQSDHKTTAVQELFSFDMLNIQLAYLESRIGVARRVTNFNGEQQREYKVDGCDIIAYVRKNDVVGYALPLGGREQWRSAPNKCNVEILAANHLRTNNLTLGKFVEANGLGIGGPAEIFHSSCIYMCGNAADPTVELRWEGPHAVNFLKIDLVSIIANGGSIEAAEKWKT